MTARDGFGRSGSNQVDTFLRDLNVGSVLTLKPSAKYATGARTILRINNEIVSFVMSVSWQIRTNNIEINTIDNYFPDEIAPTRVQVSGTMSGFIVPGKSLTNVQVQSDALSFLFNKYITIEVRDSATDSILFKANKCVVTDSAHSLQAESPGNFSLNFTAIGWQNEQAPSLPEGYNGTSSGSPANDALGAIKKFLK
jgi:hypothetical protein